MKHFFKLFLIVLTVIFQTGCLKVETNITVNKDGSGTIDETILMSKVFVDILTEFSQAVDDTTVTQEFSLFNEEEIMNAAGNYGEDVKYVSSERISNTEWEGFKATYSFADLNKIQLRPDPDGKLSVGMDEDETTDESPDYYFFNFTSGNISEVTIDRPDIEEDFNDDDTLEQEIEIEDEEIDDQFVNMMEGMNILVTMQFNGEIVETNASYVEGSKITLIGLDVGKLLQDKENLEMFKKKQPSSITELQEMVDKVPGMKLELQKPVTVNFK